MTIYECQVCPYLTNDPLVAKEHNKENKNHYFKQLHQPTYRDVLIQKKVSESL